MSTVEAVEADLADLAKRDRKLAGSGLAASALVLAAGLDSGASLGQKAVAAKELQTILSTLRELCPPEKQKDRVDDLRDRRAKRLGGSKAKNPELPDVSDEHGR